MARWRSAFAALSVVENDLNTPSNDPYGDLEVPSIASLEAETADDQRALDTGSDAPTVKFDLGAGLLYLGLLTHNVDEVRRARSLSKTATTLFQEQQAENGHPGTYLINAPFTLAESDLALGSASAPREYCEATDDMLYADRDLPPKIVDTAAHTDVRLIVRERPGRRSASARILRMVDTAAATGRAPRCDS